MKVHLKIFPIADLCEQRQEMEISLDEGSMGEVETFLLKRLGMNPDKIETIMFILNGCGLGSRKDVVLRDGDMLWLLPQISGG